MVALDSENGNAVERWLKEYRITHPPKPVLKSIVVDHMQAFDYMTKERMQKILEQADTPDEDGFILVTKSKKQLKRMKV